MASDINKAGSSISSTVLSKSTVHRRRQKQRENTGTAIKEAYVPSACVVHWDSKLMPECSEKSRDIVDRLPILVTSIQDANIKLLGVPVLPSGTGKSTSNAVSAMLDSWKCTQFVVGMYFDTSSNTGWKNGAATLLELSIGRKLLWLSCRHHINEILLSDIFCVCFGPSSGPDISMFKKFRQKWTKLAKHNPSTQPAEVLIETSESVKFFIQNQLKESHVRKDYLELLQLAGLVVGLDIKVNIFKFIYF